MQTRKLGWTDLNLTTVGFGAWAIGGTGWKFGWGHQDDEKSVAAIHRAIDLGVNWIDTAAVYGFGHSEEVVGKAVKGLRDKVAIATKCCRVWDENGNISGCLTKEGIRSEIEASLKRLQIDVIDLYQVHWPDPEKELEEGWGAIADAIKEGKIRYAGVSNFSVKHIKRCQPIHPVASLQPPYSMLERRAEKELFGYCASNEIGIVAYSPMVKGLLTGKITPERIRNMPKDDHRRNDPRFLEPQLSMNLGLVEDLLPIAEKNGKTLAQLAIAWVLRRPEVTAAIVGTRNPSQIEETVAATDWELPEEDIAAVNALLKGRKQALDQIE